MVDLIINTLLFACVGVTVEVLFTAVANFRKKHDWILEGHSYVWMIAIYASAYPMFILFYPIAESWPILIRGIIYLIIIFTIEYASGWIVRKITGECPWEKQYHGKKWIVNDLIRLDYAPAWLVFALILERLYIFLSG